jgi:urease accessory protein UreF
MAGGRAPARRATGHGGWPGVAARAGGVFGARPITSLESLREFLRAYHERILLPQELPAIRTAFNHISRNEVRELIAFDQQLATEPGLQAFAGGESANRPGATPEAPAVARRARMVQRYLAAVESGQAHGWHTLVYGMTLVLYSLPLRQGLLGYAQQTTRGFIHAAARTRGWKERDCAALFEEFCTNLPVEAETPRLVVTEK